MWISETVSNYLETESTIRSKALVTAEWNLNILDNIDELGNYRYRWSNPESPFVEVPATFSKETALSTTKHYYNAANADIVIDGGFDDNGDPLIFTSKNKKMASLFSLEDCLGRFRPRSGINKVIYFEGKYLNRVHADMARQPRFYFATPDDKFKYWTSYRTEKESVKLESSVSKVYASESVNNQFITKIKSFANSFQAGDRVVFAGTGIATLDGKTFTINSASSNYVKISSTTSIVSSTTAATAGATITSNSSRGLVRGLSYRDGSSFPIDDAAPFVVYKNKVAANRLVVKMQTKVGELNAGTYYGADGKQFSDPFADTPSNKAVPSDWVVQTLNENNEWVDAYDFGLNPYDIPSHGHVELSYGLVVPSNTIQGGIPNLRDIFLIAGTIGSAAALPIKAPEGYAYLVASTTGPGTFYVAKYSAGEFQSYETFPATYAWQLNSQEIPTNTSNFVTDFTSPSFYTSGADTVYREFDYVKGIRVVVKEMAIENATFDLIEMSARLSANITDMVTNISISKHASDLGSSGMPVGQLLAATGSVDIFDYDQSFNANNPNSIIAGLSSKNLQVKVYESLFPGDGTVYSVPIKTMYADGFPEISHDSRQVSVRLKDLFFHFDSMKAPELLIPNCSLSMAVSCLMDSVGFSNYTFVRPSGETKEPVIPYFFVGPDTTVAQVLEDLAVSTQTAMFFDEYNNLVLMSKEYLMPKDENVRATDITLVGDSSALANIAEISSENDDVYNDGKISYETKYIQKSYASLAQASYLDSDKTWVYKPVLLWEVSPEENTKSWNDESNKQSAYTLSAIPLDSDLSDNLPTVVDGSVIDNIMDLGEAVYWLSRYNGYFYANGEIIRFDAVEYNVAGVGDVWISDVEEYQKYFANIPFGGKIYPTGRVRIFSEPFYENGSLKSGAVARHGRGQFGTEVANHASGLSGTWASEHYRKTIFMKSTYMFNGGSIPETYQNVKSGVLSSVGLSKIKQASVNGVIKNYLNAKDVKEAEANKLATTNPGTIQSSALVMDGPSYPSTVSPQDFVQYVYKPLSNTTYNHFSTRMRIIGSMEDERLKTQTPVGNMPYYTVGGKNIGGSSGGIGIWVDPTTNCGYYYEIVALTDTESNAYTSTSEAINTVFFYKIQARADGVAIPVLLWSGLAPITVDDGRFTGQTRQTNEKNPTVYDLGVEFSIKPGKSVEFFLYMNDTMIGTAVDKDPLLRKNNIALFVRGSTRAMFENVMAVTENYAVGSSTQINAPVKAAFGFDNKTTSIASRKYALSGAMKQTVLDGISSTDEPKYNVYFEEFGTIMRECAYFNIKYDKAFPALSAKVSPTFNNNQGYAISGFTANAFGAQFLVFNTTDTVLSLDSGSGNYLRIQGVTFTQNSRHDLTVDQFFEDRGNLSDPTYQNGEVYNQKYAEAYVNVKKNRLTNGTKSFTINAPYIQSQDAATDMMQWLTGKIMKPRKAVGIRTFSMPHIQLGDIVEVQYDKDGIGQISSGSTGRYVVYSIEYSRSSDGPETTLYLSEVK